MNKVEIYFIECQNCLKSWEADVEPTHCPYCNYGDLIIEKENDER